MSSGTRQRLRERFGSCPFAFLRRRLEKTLGFIKKGLREAGQRSEISRVFFLTLSSFLGAVFFAIGADLTAFVFFACHLWFGAVFFYDFTVGVPA